MLSTRTRNTIIALVASAGIGAAAATPAVSLAQPKAPGPAVPRTCTYKTPLGTVLTYNEGDTVTVKNASGYKITYKCTNGAWVEVIAQTSVPTAPTSVAPNSGEATTG